jgi:O-antigen ligase
LADSDRESKPRTGTSAKIAGRLYHFLTRAEVAAAVYIALLCAAFVLETRGHRNLFYIVGLPIFLLQLRRFDWRWLKGSILLQITLVYLSYFLLSGLWSDGLSWASFADLLRVSLLLLLFLLITLQLCMRDGRFAGRTFQWYAAAAGASLVVVFAVAALGLRPSGPRFSGIGLAEHPIIGATLYGVALLLAAFELLPRTTDRRLRLFWLLVIALCAAFMLLSGSRGPLFALAAALAVGLAIADRRAAMVVAALVAAGIAASALFDFHPVVILYERAQSGHFEIWQQTVAAIAERPLFGHGSLVNVMFEGKYGPVRSPHNLVLANQLYGGIPATVLLASLLLLALRQACHALRAGKPIYLVLLVFAFVASLFDTRSLVLNLGREWVTFWLPIALLAAQELLRRREAPRAG